MDPVPDPLLLRKSGSAGDRTRDLCICSQKLWPLDHRGGPSLTSLFLCFQNHFILYPFCSNVSTAFILSLQIFCAVKFARPNDRHISNSFFSPFSVFRLSSNFPAAPKTFFLFVTLAMLPRCQTSFNRSSRRAQ